MPGFPPSDVAIRVVSSVSGPLSAPSYLWPFRRPCGSYAGRSVDRLRAKSDAWRAMSGPPYPPPDPAAAGVPERGGPLSGGLEDERPIVTSDAALVPDMQVWLNDVVKAIKGFRVYADNNEMLLKFVEHAFMGLEFLLGRDPELTLTIREDRILYGREVVHVSTDRTEGLPFLLYRNAFRRIVLVKGMTRDELVGLMRAISTDYSAYDHFGEDLVTALWRLQLPHVRYLTIDALSRFRNETNDEQEREEIERIQADIENIVAAIYKTGAADDDLVAGVSISREDLEALREIRAEDPEDLELLDHATERAITDVPESQLQRVSTELGEENRDELTRRILDIFVQILFRETSTEHSTNIIDLIQQLFDAMVLARRYSDATDLAQRLRRHADAGDSMQEMHVARHLLGLFATESRVFPVLSTLNEQNYAVSASELFEFLRSLGSSVSPLLVRALDSMTSPAHRRAICELIVELGVPSLRDLAEVSGSAKWFVVRDILGLAQQYGLADIGPLVANGLNHEHPKVRQTAVGMLRGYGRGAADHAIASRMNDEDIDVRLTAYRVAAARRSRDVLPVLEGIIGSDKLAQREVRELRLMMAAYAAIAGTSGIALLSRILNAGIIASLTNTDVQVAAAYALASIGPEATSALQRGSRTLNPKVREACKRALSHDLKRRFAQQELLRGRLPGVTDDVVNRPFDDTATEDREFRPTSADLDFTMGEGGNADPLAEAPPLRVDGPLVSGEIAVAPNVDRPRPALPRVDGPGPHKDEIPMNLPPPPSRDLPGASAGEIPLGGRLNILGAHSVDLVPGMLPPVPLEGGAEPTPPDDPLAVPGRRLNDPPLDPPPGAMPRTVPGRPLGDPPLDPPPGAMPLGSDGLVPLPDLQGNAYPDPEPPLSLPPLSGPTSHPPLEPPISGPRPLSRSASGPLPLSRPGSGPPPLGGPPSGSPSSGLGSPDQPVSPPPSFGHPSAPPPVRYPSEPPPPSFGHPSAPPPARYPSEPPQVRQPSAPPSFGHPSAPPPLGASPSGPPPLRPPPLPRRERSDSGALAEPPPITGPRVPPSQPAASGPTSSSTPGMLRSPPPWQRNDYEPSPVPTGPATGSVPLDASMLSSPGEGAHPGGPSDAAFGPQSSPRTGSVPIDPMLFADPPREEQPPDAWTSDLGAPDASRSPFSDGARSPGLYSSVTPAHGIARPAERRASSTSGAHVPLPSLPALDDEPPQRSPDMSEAPTPAASLPAARPPSSATRPDADAPTPPAGASPLSSPPLPPFSSAPPDPIGSEEPTADPLLLDPMPGEFEELFARMTEPERAPAKAPSNLIWAPESGPSDGVGRPPSGAAPASFGRSEGAARPPSGRAAVASDAADFAGGPDGDELLDAIPARPLRDTGDEDATVTAAPPVRTPSEAPLGGIPVPSVVEPKSAGLTWKKDAPPPRLPPPRPAPKKTLPEGLVDDLTLDDGSGKSDR